MYTQNDLALFEARGVTPEQIDKQVANFKTGFNAVTLTGPATVGNGIIRIEKQEEDMLLLAYDKAVNEMQITKMVPASGSATRMFKDLFSYLNSADDAEMPGNIENFFAKIESLPFYNSLDKTIAECGESLSELREKGDFKKIMNYVLVEGLKYGDTPKGLIEFHTYADIVRTPFDEHLAEGALYASVKGISNIHFTVSEEHTEKFKKHLEEVVKLFEKKFGIKYNVSFSIQKPSTDTVSIESNGELLRDDKGNIIFRPGGHGALIHNLNDLDADIVFVKNIDNVSPDKNKPDTCLYKKLIAGLLVNLQEKIFGYLKQLDKEDVAPATLQEINAFAKEKLGFKGDKEEYSIEELKDMLNRPIRVCGMVKNEGEPGGGPFWVKCDNGERLMICESAQIDLKEASQKAIFDASTHFNPVDLVCGIKDYKGNKFNLLDYVAQEQGFINYKSYKGRDIEVQELPGLWNGAMANWITLFVEVPLTTFTPVKTVFDLFKPEHQN